MKRISIFTIVALITFFIGVASISLLAFRYSQYFGEAPSGVETRILPTTIGEVPAEASPEEKAVRIAEEFIARNGYTDVPADRNNISYETVEFADDIDELLEARANTLERKAYGILFRGSGTRMGKEGWTVVFRSKNISDDFYRSICLTKGKKVTKENHPIGRAVTMDANFQDLLVEHKTFPLKNVDKQL